MQNSTSIQIKLIKDYTLMDSDELGKRTRRSKLINAGSILKVYKLITFHSLFKYLVHS